MSPSPLQNAELSENYYFDFFQQNPDGLFRIDFDQPIPINDDFLQFYKKFLESSKIGEYNSTFDELGLLTKTENSDDLRFSAEKNCLPLITRKIVTEFYEASFSINEVELEHIANENHRYFSFSMFGIIKNHQLVCIWCKLRDVTVEKVLLKSVEEEKRNLLLTQKIEALGRLAGGIAHDFNNFLAVIMLQNDLLNLQLPAGNALRHRTEEMKQATAKAAAMVKQLLAVGRKQRLNPTPTLINQLILEFVKNCQSHFSDKISLEVKLSPDAGVCFIDQQQALQTLTNLAQNAAEAMPDGGRLTFETSIITLDKTSVFHKSQPEGSFVQISIEDSGTGMDAATLESVFEPFFSNKKSSKGVGLGLATAYGFVKQSKGFIWVESEIGRGTKFTIQFPRIDQPETQN